MEQFYYEDTAVVENADADCHSLLKASALLRYYHNCFPRTMTKTNAKNRAIIHLLKKSGYTAENPDAPRIINWIRKKAHR